jgi:molybdate transport system ATP-binding protein
MVQLAVGTESILARVTRRSVAALDVRPGQPLFAILKAVSVAPEGIGAADPANDGPALAPPDPSRQGRATDPAV